MAGREEGTPPHRCQMLAARDAAAAYQRRDMARVFQTARPRRANLCLRVAGESGDGTRRPRRTGRASSRRNGQCGGAASVGRHPMGGIRWATAVAICLIGSWWRALRGARAGCLNSESSLINHCKASSLSHTCASTPRRSSCVPGETEKERETQRERERFSSKKKNTSSWSRGIEKRPHPLEGRQTCDKSPPPKKRGRRRLVRRAPRWRLTRNGRPRIPTR